MTNCGKMFLLDKLLKKLKEKGHRVLVFCQVRRGVGVLLRVYMYIRVVVRLGGGLCVCPVCVCG